MEILTMIIRIIRRQFLKIVLKIIRGNQDFLVARNVFRSSFPGPVLRPNFVIFGNDADAKNYLQFWARSNFLGIEFWGVPYKGVLNVTER